MSMLTVGIVHWSPCRSSFSFDADVAWHTAPMHKTTTSSHHLPQIRHKLRKHCQTTRARQWGAASPTHTITLAWQRALRMQAWQNGTEKHTEAPSCHAEGSQTNMIHWSSQLEASLMLLQQIKCKE